MDPKALNLLNRDLPIYIQPADLDGMKRVGFNNIQTIEDEIIIGDVTITRIEGRHVDLDPLLPMIGESSGFLLSTTGLPTILWTGDTILTDSLIAAIEKYKPQIIITHSGGAQLPIDNRGNKTTLLLDDKETIKIAKLAPEAKIIAIHLEAFINI